MITMYEAKNDVKDYIEANLETLMVAYETATGLTIDRWKFLDTYQSPGQQYPCVSILARRTPQAYDNGPGNRADNKFVQRYHQLDIVVWHRGNRDASRSIEDNIIGYMDVFATMFELDAHLGDERRYRLVRKLDTDYTDLFPDDQAKTQTLLLKGAVFSIELRPNY